MQAAVYYRYGPPEVLSLQEFPQPTPIQNQVLVRVRAASVNPYDWHFLRGTPSFIRLFTGLTRPKFPGLGADLAGIVEAVGPAVTQLKPGDVVFGTGRGSFAQFACAPEATLALKPPGSSFEQAAAAPIAGITALQALRDCGHLQPGQSILINGASGGVGTFAVQIAASLGAVVTGVCSTRNVDLVCSLGAADVIDYTRENFTRLPARYDLLFDLVGNQSLSALRRALQPKGVYIGCGGGGPDRSSADLLATMLSRPLQAPFIRQKLTGVLAKVNTADLNQLATLMESGKVSPVFDRSFPLTEIAAAIGCVETCHARGKVIISIT